LGNGWRRRPGIGVTDHRKIEMPPFYRRPEATLAPQPERIWVESFSLTTGIYGKHNDHSGDVCAD
jgi:hypothetical protein